MPGADIILSQLAALSAEIAQMRSDLRDNTVALTMPLESISDSHEHGTISDEERWRRINRFELLVRNRRESHYLSNGDIMCRVLGRYWMFLNGQDGYVAQHILAHGYWELSCTELVATEVRQGMTVVDAGANIGYFSLLMAEKVGPSGHLYLFEPTPKLLKNLEKSLFLNGYTGRYTLVTDPLWDKVGEELLFSIPIEDTKNATLLGDPRKQNDVITVKTTTLDGIVPAGKIVDFMKVDVEGAEPELWSGMQRVLSESPDIRIFLEYNAGRINDAGAFLDKIVSDGFELAFLDPIKGVTAASRDQLLTENFGEDWMLFLKRS